jgi:hypothetical protein
MSDPVKLIMREIRKLSCPELLELSAAMFEYGKEKQAEQAEQERRLEN